MDDKKKKSKIEDHIDVYDDEKAKKKNDCLEQNHEMVIENKMIVKELMYNKGGKINKE